MIDNHRMRLLRLAGCLLIILFTLAGCAGGRFGAAFSSAASEQAELVWLMSADPDKNKWQEKMVAEFGRTHPHIRVKLLNIPYEQFDRKLAALIASGHAPDVWNPNQADSGFATYLRMGALLDLSPYYENSKAEMSGLDGKMMDVYRVNGKLYGIPYISNATYLYYNKDLFDRAQIPYPPTNWDDTEWTFETMRDVARQLTEATGNPETHIYGFMHELSPNALTWAFGGDLLPADAYETGMMRKPNVVTPENTAAIRYFSELALADGVSPSHQALSAAYTLGNPFLSGKIAMTLTGGWGLRSYQSADFRWGVAAVPYHEGRQLPLYVDPWSISAATPHPDEAWEFVKFLASPDGGAGSYMTDVGRTPAESGLLARWYEATAAELGMDARDLREVHEGALKYGRRSDNHLVAYYPIILDTMNQSMGSVWNGTTSVEEGLAAMQRNLESLHLE